MSNEDDIGKLTRKQELFCIHYSRDGNGTNSAIKAGYAKDSADVQASKLLTLPKVQAKIQEIDDLMIRDVFISKQTQLHDLERLKGVAQSSGNLKIVISAIQEQNKIMGFYAVEKKEVAISGVQIITKDAEMNTLVTGLIEEVVIDDGVVV